jgi:DNA-binding transcriptional ArsR family regulator
MDSRTENPSLKLAMALSHPTRVRILMAMNTPARRMSPKHFSDEARVPISDVSYHFRRLQKLGFVTVVDEVPVRGAMQHFYEPVKRALAWTKETESLPPGINDRFAATALRGFFEEAGGSIDAGNFSARPDRHLSWDKMWVDEQGWHKLIALWSSTLAQAMEIEEECAERRQDGASGFYMSYLLAAFESFPPPPPSA